MQRNTKKFAARAVVLLIALAAALALTLTGCGKEEGGKTENTLAFEVPAGAEGVYGTYFQLTDLVGTDTEGNYYFPSVKVFGADGSPVIVEDGRFFISKLSDYTVRYALTFEGSEVVRETIVKVFDRTAPTLRLALETDIVPAGGSYEIPAAEAIDDCDEADAVTVVTTVTRGGEPVPVTGGGASFDISEAGDYLVLYRATDSSGNASEKTLTVSAVDETGCVTYFSHPLGATGVSNSGYAASGGIREDYGFGGETRSYGVSFNTTAFNADGPYVTVDLNAPFITDITPHKYLYFYVYSPAVTVSVALNNTWTPEANLVRAGQVKKVYIERTADGSDYLYMGTKLFTESEYSTVKSPKNISGFRITVSAVQAENPGYDGSGFGTIYFSPIRVADEIPLASVSFDKSTYFTGERIAIPAASHSGFTAFSQKTYLISGGRETEVSDTFEPDAAGQYTFRFDLFEGEHLSESVISSILVVAEEPGVVSYLHRDFGLSGIAVANYAASLSDEIVYGDEGRSTRLIPTTDAFNAFTSMGAINGGLQLTNPAIKDIRGYKYLSFYVYSARADMRLYANNGATLWDDYLPIPAGSWTRVVATNVNGTFWFAGSVPYLNPAQAADITNFGFNFYVPHAGNESLTSPDAFGGVYLSAIRVSNELLTAAVELPRPSVLLGETVTIPTASHEGFTDFSQRVYLGFGGTFTELTGETFTPEAAGNYTLRFDVYEAGRFIDRVEKSLAVVAREEGVVAYFHRPYGGTEVDTGEMVSAEMTQAQAYGAEEYSLDVNVPQGWPKLYLTAPAITNLNEKAGADYMYNYLIFYARAEVAGLTLWLNNAAAGAVTLQPGVWTEIVAVRRGPQSFYFGGTDIFAPAEGFTATAADIAGSFIRFDNNVVDSYKRVYLSAIRALPALDAGEGVAAPLGGGAGWAAATVTNYLPASSTELTRPGESFALRLTPSADNRSIFDTDGYCAGDFTLSAPSIRDISAYEYLYFYVYSPSAAVKVYGKNAGEPDNWAESAVEVPKETWTLVSLRRDSPTTCFMGNFQIIGPGTGAQVSDITGLGFRVNILKSDNPSVRQRSRPDLRQLCLRCQRPPGVRGLTGRPHREKKAGPLIGRGEAYRPLYRLISQVLR